MSIVPKHRLLAARLGLFVFLLFVRPSATSTAPARLAPATLDRPGPFAAEPSVRFERNLGQFDAAVRFVGRGKTGDTLLGDRDATFVARSRRADGAVCSSALTLKLPSRGAPRASDLLSSVSNYFIGNDPGAWRTKVPHFGAVTYPAAVGGIDVTFHGSSDGDVEYDLDVPPGADLASFTIGIDGGEASLVDGRLVVHTPCGDMIQPRPRVFQRARALVASFRLASSSSIGFDVDDYDPSSPLVIDPVIMFATPVPGADGSTTIANDAAGNTYFAGYTWGASFPVSNAYQATNAGAGDIVLAKFTANGSALVYATYLGGSQPEGAQDIAVDSSQNVYLVGGTQSYDFPTVNALQSTHTESYQAFVTKLDASGSALVYSTYLGGSKSSSASGIAVDASGAAYVAGGTEDTDFPTSPGAYQTVNQQGASDGFVTKLDPSGASLSYSTLLGGSYGDGIGAIALGIDGSAYVTGTTQSVGFPYVPFPTVNAVQASHGGGGVDAFAARLTPDGTGLVFSTYLGGNVTDYGVSIAVGSSGAAYVVGRTESANFPVKNAFQGTLSGTEDAFVTEFDASGALVTSTFLGGSTNDRATAVGLGPTNEVYVAGVTQSSNFPTQRPLQATYGGGQDCFLTRFDSSVSQLLYSTYFGGGGTEWATSLSVDGAGTAYLDGNSPWLTQYSNAIFNSGGVFVAKIGTLTLWPSPVTVPPKGTQAFTASEGSGGGYVFALQTNLSGANVTGAGVYTAGATGNVVDVVKLTDSAATVATAVVTVGPGVSISPPTSGAPPKGSIAFAAAGGSGSGYVWSLLSNNSGASVASSTGAYVAGSTPNVSDVVSVTDPLGNAATAVVKVGQGVSITPKAPAVPPHGSIGFSASGGSANGYTWSFAKNLSGGSINSSTGAYVAGGAASIVDAVQVADSLGNIGVVNVSVGGGIAINPAVPSSPPRGSIAFGAVGGAGTGFVWTLTTSASGATIDVATGLYVAGAKGNVTDTIQVVDPLGNDASVSVAVGPPMSVTPGVTAVGKNVSVAFAAVGGAGHDYAWALAANPSGATIHPTTGVYTSGMTGGADKVQVTDPLGNSAVALVFVDVPRDAGVDSGLPPARPALGGGGCDCRMASGDSEAPWLLLVGVAMIARRRHGRRTGAARKIP